MTINYGDYIETAVLLEILEDQNESQNNRVAAAEKLKTRIGSNIDDAFGRVVNPSSKTPPSLKIKIAYIWIERGKLT